MWLDDEIVRVGDWSLTRTLTYCQLPTTKGLLAFFQLIGDPLFSAHDPSIARCSQEYFHRNVTGESILIINTTNSGKVDLG